MPFHLAGWLEDIDPAGAFVNLAALADQALFTSGDDIRVPELNRVIMAAGGLDGVVRSQVRFDSPTLDQNVRPQIQGLNSQNAAAVEPDSPPRLMKMLRNPWTLGVDENLTVQINSNPAAAQDQWALLWFADGPVTPIEGADIFQARLTGTATLVANAWTAVTMVLDEALPPGEYMCVGLWAESLGLVACRINFLTGQNWRPGCLGVDTINDIPDDVFRDGRLGDWGRFPFTQIPQFEFLSVVADTVETVVMDLVRVA